MKSFFQFIQLNQPRQTLMRSRNFVVFGIETFTIWFLVLVLTCYVFVASLTSIFILIHGSHCAMS